LTIVLAHVTLHVTLRVPKGGDGMIETYRMLGEQHRAELIREAEKLARAAAVSGGRRRGRGRYGLRVVVTALSHLRAGRASKRVRLEIDAIEEGRLPSGPKGGTATPIR
jgi:hypothetical protein